MTLEETMLVIQGYRKKNNDQLQQTRMVMYAIASTVTEESKRGEVYDVFFIPGDPTMQERKQAKQDKYDAMVKANKEFAEQVRKDVAEGRM